MGILVMISTSIAVGSNTAVDAAATSLLSNSMTTTRTSITCTAAAGRVAVAVVVVHGDGASPIVRCVDLPNTANGIDALRGTGFNTRIERGFVCGIDGIPVSGCATGAGFDGAYWRYFRGAADGRWNYANVGAGSRLERHDGCAYEAWVWSAEQQISPPGVSPGGIRCLTAAADTRPPATTTTRVPPTSAPKSPGSPSAVAAGPTGPSGPGGSTGDASGDPFGSDGAADTTAHDDRSGRSVGRSDGSRVSNDNGPSNTDTRSPVVEADDGIGDPSSDEPGSRPGDQTIEVDLPEDGPSRGVGDDGPGSGEVAAADDQRAARAVDGSGSPVGTFAAVVLVFALGAGAVVVGRRRTARSTQDP